MNAAFSIRHLAKAFRTAMCHQQQATTSIVLRKYLRTQAGMRGFLNLSWKGGDIQGDGRNNLTILRKYLSGLPLILLKAMHSDYL